MKREAFIIENGIVKQKSQTVFDGLYLPIYGKEVVGVICDSTVEKKFLLQFLKGELELTGGSLYVEGEKRSVKEAGRLIQENIAVIEKKSKLISALGTFENVYLFSDRRNLLFKDQYEKKIRELIEEFKLPLPPEDRVGKLGACGKVMMELLKAFVEGKKMVVLADLTGFLRKNELEEVGRLTKRLQNAGMSFLILEPFEDIAFEWSQRLVVIRHGKTMEVFDSGHVNRHSLYEALMGVERKSPKVYSPVFKTTAVSNSQEEEVLSFCSVYSDYLKDITFQLEKGGLLKIFCLDDKSAEEIVSLLCGERRAKEGKILLNDKPYRPGSYTQAMKRGVCYLGESPYEKTLVYDMTVKDNISLVLSRKSSYIWLKYGFSKSLEQRINEFFGEPIAHVKLRKLSPEVLQKLAHFKWILFHPKVVICMKPFAEIDIHIQEITEEMLNAYKEQGIAVILLTANYAELCRMEGETIYIREGCRIDEDQVYQILYGDG